MCKMLLHIIKAYTNDGQMMKIDLNLGKNTNYKVFNEPMHGNVYRKNFGGKSFWNDVIKLVIE